MADDPIIESAASIPPVDAAAAPEPVAPQPAPANLAPVVEAAPVAVDAPKHPAETPSLLETFGKEAEKPKSEAEDEKKPDAPAADAKKPEDPKPAEASKPTEAETAAAKVAEDAAKAAAAAPEPISYADLKLPDGLVKDEKLDAFTGMIGKHNVPVETAQELLGLHHDAMTKYAEHLNREQYRIFGETRQGWQKQVMADEQIGGAGHQTAMGAIARMRDMGVAEADRPAFEEFLRVTGAGDHPQFLKMLHNFAKHFDEPGLPPPNPKPPKDIGGRPGRRGVLYDHPTSTGRQ